MVRFGIDKELPEIRRLGAFLKKIVLTVVVTSVTAGCSGLGTATGPNRPYAPMQANPFWRENWERLDRERDPNALETIPRGIFLRIESTGSTLVKFANSDDIFRYVIGSGAITPATAEDWKSADKEVDCRSVQFVRRRALDLNETEGIVTTQATGRQVPSHARYALDVYESPDGRRALILSAEGPRQPGRPSIIGFGGAGGGTRGVRYAQVFNLDRHAYSNDAVALKSVAAEEPMFRFCWGPDQKIAVAYELQRLDVISYLEINFHIIETPR